MNHSGPTDLKLSKNGKVPWGDQLEVDYRIKKGLRPNNNNNNNNNYDFYMLDEQHSYFKFECSKLTFWA